MGNQISTPATAVMAPASNAPIKLRENLFYNAFRKSFTNCLLPTKIWFEILTFVKFHEAPNIFLVNRYLLPICHEYFLSGTVGQNKHRIVRDLYMQLTEGSLTILVKRNGTLQSVPVPEVDPPKIFNAFGSILVEKCCRIEAIRFLNKFQSLLTKENNGIICTCNFFCNNHTANVRRWFWQRDNSNSPSKVDVDEKKLFLNLIEQKGLLLELKADALSKGIARCLADEPLIAGFNGHLLMKFKNVQNLCGLEEDAKLIYGWILLAAGRKLQIYHYNAQKARELASQIALLFAQAHVNKEEAEKMDLAILLPKDTVVPMHEQKIFNGIGEQLATLRVFSAKCSDGYVTSAYVFYTKPMEYCYENKEEFKLLNRLAIYFL